ncbi:unnamed protein product [Boreogadus saida]
MLDSQDDQEMVYRGVPQSTGLSSDVTLAAPYCWPSSGSQVFEGDQEARLEACWGYQGVQDPSTSAEANLAVVIGLRGLPTCNGVPQGVSNVCHARTALVGNLLVPAEPSSSGSQESLKIGQIQGWLFFVWSINQNFEATESSA